MGKPHKYAEVIKAWADGGVIQFRDSGGDWTDFTGTNPNWSILEWRIKPESPNYPKSRMTDRQLQYHMPVCTHEFISNVRRVADVAIARAIEDGQVVFVPNYMDALKFSSEPMVPAAMLEKVAEAVRAELVAQVERYSTGCATYINGETDLAAIIKRVKEGK